MAINGFHWGYFTPLIGVRTTVVTGRGPPCILSESIIELPTPGDSIPDLFIPKRWIGHQQLLKGSLFYHPPKPAELAGMHVVFFLFRFPDSDSNTSNGGIHEHRSKQTNSRRRGRGEKIWKATAVLSQKGPVPPPFADGRLYIGDQKACWVIW